MAPKMAKSKKLQIFFKVKKFVPKKRRQLLLKIISKLSSCPPQNCFKLQFSLIQEQQSEHQSIRAAHLCKTSFRNFYGRWCSRALKIGDHFKDYLSAQNIFTLLHLSQQHSPIICKSNLVRQCYESQKFTRFVLLKSHLY